MKWLFLLYMIMTMQVDFTDSDQATLAKAVGMKNSKRLESLHNQSKSHKSFKEYLINITTLRITLRLFYNPSDRSYEARLDSCIYLKLEPLWRLRWFTIAVMLMEHM